MPTTLLDAFLLFGAGILLDMSLVHLLNVDETRHHPMIRMWKWPRLASSVWGVIQLFCGGFILLALDFKFALDVKTLLVFLGFSGWAILIGYWSSRREQRSALKMEGS